MAISSHSHKFRTAHQIDPGKDQEPALHAKDQPLKARLLRIPQQGQAHLQAVVRGDIVETKQEAERTVIPQEAAPPQEESSSEQEALERMASLETTADLIESADGQMALITEKLDRITRETMDISSFTLADPRTVSDLKEMDDRLQSEMRKLSGRGTEEEREGLDPTIDSCLCHALHTSVHHVNQLRQRLEKVQSAAQALERFLATAREAEAEIPNLLANQEPNRQRNEAARDQERDSWQAAMHQRLWSAREQAESVDSLIKAAGMTLSLDGATVTCRDVVVSLSRRLEEVDKELTGSRREENKEKELCHPGKEQIPENEELNPKETCWTKTRDDSPGQGQAEEQEHHTPSGMEPESGLEPKKSRWNERNEESRTQTEEEQNQEEKHKAQRRIAEGEVLKAKAQRGSSQGKKEGEEKKSTIQSRFALLAALREIQGAAERLGLQEPTLPAVQQRVRALTGLDSRLADQQSELQYLRDTSSQSGVPDVRHIGEMEDLWAEAQRAVTERLEQCRVLTELLKRFQSIRGELSCTLQRAECTISEQASYMGKENLQRLHSTVQATKAELNGLGDGIEEVRSICRQLQTHLRKIPECTIIPFEGEADALMDRWLDVTERTDSHLDNLHLGLALWDGVLQLGGEVESWTVNKLAAFTQSPSFQTEEEVRALQDEILAQEENMERFHCRAAEIQVLLQSTEPPLELQVVETQMRKKMEQVKELFCEVEDVYRHMVAAKGHVSARMAECHDSLQKIQDSLVTLSGPDAATVLAKIQDIGGQLQTQNDQADGLLEDLRLMACIAIPESLQSLAVDGIQLQEEIRAAHQLLSQVEEQTERDVQALNRLQRESEHLEQWLQTAEEKAEEDGSLLQEEAFQQRERTETLSQLLSSLQSSPLKQSTLVRKCGKLLDRYHNLQTNIQQVDSPLSESLSLQSPIEQSLHNTQPRLKPASLRKSVAPKTTRGHYRVASEKMWHSLKRTGPREFSE
ncbi:nesprin-2-like [Centroberyx affinis]|uniref:nesprin-2-like n=1 Tax=Centroberyx affinis TaxID=166261 RepID=UPI003A5C3F43